MKIFVTGASGHIGSLVTAELAAAGHTVIGLSRSEAGMQRVSAAGGTPLLGSMDDLDLLAREAAESDGVVHLAFKHDAADFAAAIASEAAAIDALGDALAGSGKPLAAASGTLIAAGTGGDGPVTEDARADPTAAANPRAGSEARLLALAERGVAAVALRFAPTVHGPTDRHGFIPTLIANARRLGHASYVGDGATRWPAVHNLDAARLIRLAVEAAPAGGVALHAAAEEGIEMREIARAIAVGAGVPAVSVTAERAAAENGFIGGLLGVDNPTSNAKTRELLGWEPTHPGLLADLGEGFYFER